MDPGAEDEEFLTSRDLVQRAQEGDDPALTALIERHLPALRAYVRARTDPIIRARESSSDIVQSVCREVLGGLENYEWQGEGSFRYWLFSVAMNKLKGRKKYLTARRRDVARNDRVSIDGLRRSQIAEGYQALASPSQVAMANEDVKQLEFALDRLPENFRELILMSRLAGMSHAEIAAQMGKKEGAVRTMLHRALAKLTTEMMRRPSE
jgi:RNA polymerase sigma-70 factor, ECF subfamily